LKIFENLNLQDLENEIWKDIVDYDGDYQVSNFGRIKSLKFKNEKILRQNKDNKEYLFINLCKNGKYKPKRIHILVYETFNNYKLKEDECVHHNKDWCKENNNFDNLIMMSKKEHNKLHMKGKNNHNFGKHHSEESKKKISEKITMSESSKGENNPSHKLKDGEVWLIKKILNSDYYKSGKISQTFIGKMFGVSSMIISYIKTGKLWSHIKYDEFKTNSRFDLELDDNDE